MDPDIISHLEKERVCALTTVLPNGAPHSAAVHFSYKIGEELVIYFSSDVTSKKATALKDTNSTLASVVIGFSETDWKTFQLDGDVKIISNPMELKDIKSIHYKRHPESQKYENDPDTIFIEFRPSWYRYSDLLQKPPKIIEVG
jgi:general stress protein 26